MKKNSDHARKGFTLIEVLIVVIVMLLLMGLLMAVNPSSERATTLARLARISSAVTTYHEHFQAYPRSFHYDTGVVDADYRWPDPVSGSAREGTFYEVISSKGLRRRDLKYIDQMFSINDETNELDDGYLIDGWFNRFVYYSGSEIFENTTTDADQVIAKWLKAVGNYDESTPTDVIAVSRGMHNPNDYFFLMSAGDDGEFGYKVLPTNATSRYDPNEYVKQPLSTANMLVPGIAPGDVNPNQESFDDMTTYNVRK